MPLSVPSSRYGVSTLEIEIPLASPLIIDDAHAKQAGKNLLQTDSILCTVFYPTQRPEKGARTGSGLSWLNAPRLKTIEGLLKYAGLSKYLTIPAIIPTYAAFSAKLPYVQNAPLANPATLTAEQTGSDVAPRGPDVFPAAVFSHGLAGGRTMYSQFLSSLASEGMVIAAIDHRDSSALATTINHPRSSPSTKPPPPETRLYARPDEIDGLTSTSPDKDKLPFRAAQLRLRTQEVGLAWDVLVQLAKGQGDEVWSRNLRKGGAKEEDLELADWKGRVDIERPIMLGHSFGGATSIEVLRDPKSPFAYGLVLDPWMEPIAQANTPGTPPIQRPLYVINSDAFTIWRSHYANVRSAVSEARQRSGRGWLITLTGSKHTDFSDFPVLLPRFLSSSLPAVDALRFFARTTWTQVLACLPPSSSSSSSDGDGDGDGGEVKRGAERDRELVFAPLLPSSASSPAEGVASNRESTNHATTTTTTTKMETEKLPAHPYPYPLRAEREGEIEARDLGQAGNVIVHKLDLRGEGEGGDWEWIRTREGTEVDGEIKVNGMASL